MKRNWKKQGESRRLARDLAKYPALPATPDKGVSPHGPFWGCGRFPKCKGTKSI